MAPWVQQHLLSPQRTFEQTTLGHVFPPFVAWRGGDGCVAPGSLWRNDVDVHKRIPVEYLEDFKKSCFITISRFYYPQITSTTIKGWSSEILSCSVQAGFSLRGKGSSPVASKAYSISDLPHPLFEAGSLSGTKMLCPFSFFLVEWIKGSFRLL